MNPRKTAAKLALTSQGQAAMAEALGLKVVTEPELSYSARVAVLVPAYRGLSPEVQAAFRELEMYSSQFCFVQRFELSKPIIHSCRNKLAREALNHAKEFTHHFWLDDDMLPEPDTLVRLLRHEKDIVGGVYFLRRPPHKPVAYKLNEKNEFADIGELPEEGITEVDACGTGCLLVKADIMHTLANFWLNCEWEKKHWRPSEEALERERAKRWDSKEPLWFQYRLNQHGQELGEDISFCQNAKDAGFSIWLDCSLRVGHLGQKAFYREDWQRPAADANYTYSFPTPESYPSMEPGNQELRKIWSPE